MIAFPLPEPRDPELASSLAMAALFDLAGIDADAWVWRQHAACRGEEQEIFYPERGESTAPAKAVCATCTVRADCLEFGLRHEKRGVWGGTSEWERRRMRNRMGIRLAALDDPTDEDLHDIEDEEDEWQ